MTAISGSTRMMMRIDVQEQLAGETLFHSIAAPGLGVWRSSDPDVKSYRFIRQVTNLSAPGVLPRAGELPLAERQGPRDQDACAAHAQMRAAGSRAASHRRAEPGARHRLARIKRP